MNSCSEVDSVDFLNHVQLDSSFIPENFRNEPWDEAVDFAYILRGMQEGTLIYSCDMRQFLEQRNKRATFNNEVHYGIIQHESAYIAVAYKPKNADDLSAAYAEKVAYDLYEKVLTPYTGHHFIPPTIVRKMPDGRMASCQFFVETEPHEDMWDATFRESVFQTASPEHVQEMAVFNAVFNNWDRHPGNYMATRRDGFFHLASIDNEAIENKGWLPLWGERSYVPVLFSESPYAFVETELNLANDLTLVDFKARLLEYGFKEVPRIKAIYNNLMNRGEGSRTCLIDNGALSVRFHQGNKAAFPLPKGPYFQKLIDAYSNLNRKTLEECLRPLIDLDPERFGTRIDDILRRRDLFLSECASF